MLFGGNNPSDSADQDEDISATNEDTPTKKAREIAAKDLYRKLPGSSYHVLELDDDSFEDTVFPSHTPISSHRPFLIMFYAPWCLLCKTVLPLFDNASRLLHNDDPNFIEHNLKEHSARMAIVNAVTNSKLSQKFHISTYPTYFYSMNGRLYEYNGSPSSTVFAQCAISLYRGFMFGSFVDDVTSLGQFQSVMSVESPSRAALICCAKTRDSKKKVAAATLRASNGGAIPKKKGSPLITTSIPQHAPLKFPEEAAKTLTERLDKLSESGDLYLSEDDNESVVSSSPSSIPHHPIARREIDYGLLNDDTQTNIALLASSRSKDMRDEFSVVGDAFATNARIRYAVIYEDEAQKDDPMPTMNTGKDSKETASIKSAYMARKKRLLKRKDRNPDSRYEAMYWSLRFRCQEIREAATHNIISAAAGKISSKTSRDWASSSNPHDNLLNLLPPPTLGPNDEILLLSSDVSEEPVHFFGQWGHFTTATEDLLKYSHPNLTTQKARLSASTVYAGHGYVRSIGSSTFVPSIDLDDFTWRYGHRGVEKINGEVLASLSQKGKIGVLVLNGDLDFNTDRKYLPVLQELARSRFMDYHNDMYEKEVEDKRVKTMEELRESVVLSGGESASRIDGMNGHQMLSAIGGSTSPQFNRVKADHESGQFTRKIAFDKMKDAREKALSSLAVLDGIVYESWLISLGYTGRRFPVFCIIDPLKEIVWIMEEWMSSENRNLLVSAEAGFGPTQLEAIRDFMAAVDAGEVRGTSLTYSGTVTYFILEYVPLSPMLYELVGSDHGIFLGTVGGFIMVTLVLLVTFQMKPQEDELYDHSRKPPIAPPQPRQQPSAVKSRRRISSLS